MNRGEPITETFLKALEAKGDKASEFILAETIERIVSGDFSADAIHTLLGLRTHFEKAGPKDKAQKYKRALDSAMGPARVINAVLAGQFTPEEMHGLAARFKEESGFHHINKRMPALIEIAQHLKPSPQPEKP